MRRETESKYLRQIEDKINLVRSEMQREQRNRQEAIENLSECLELDIQRISDEIKVQTQNRQENDGSILKKLTDDLVKANNSIQQVLFLTPGEEKQGGERTGYL